MDVEMDVEGDVVIPMSHPTDNQYVTLSFSSV